MQQILLVIQILICAALVVIVLLQQGRGADAGASFGGGSSGSLFGARGPASFLSRLTAMLAALFFANSLALAYISTQVIERRSVIERVQPLSTSEIPGLSEQPVSEVPEFSVEGGGDDVPALPDDSAPDAQDAAVPQAPESQ